MTKYWDDDSFENPTYVDQPPEFLQTQGFRGGRTEKAKLRIALENLEPGQWLKTGIFLPTGREANETSQAYAERRNAPRAALAGRCQAITRKDPSRRFITRLSTDHEIYVSMIPVLHEAAPETVSEAVSE